MTSDDLLARHRAVLPSWMPLYYAEPIELVSGSGRRVTDAQGRSYLDFFGGVLTNMIGYDIPEIREAVERQLRTGIVHSSTLYLIRQQVEYGRTYAAMGVTGNRGWSASALNPLQVAWLHSGERLRGLLVGKGGLYGNVVRMGPPLTLTEDEAREGLAILVGAIRGCASAEVAA